jgi:phosphatidylserine/phosphatidylglycerophosphate/cardiolipin synthase-like enzyme
VRIVTDNKASKPNESQYSWLRGHDKEIIKPSRKSGLMHNKFIIVDNRTVWTGSYNPTPNCTNGSNNVIVINSSIKLVEDYLTEFNELWGRKCVLSPNASVKVHTAISPSGEDNSTDVYWNRKDKIWNDDSDTVFLNDSNGTLVAQYIYYKNGSYTNYFNTSYTVNISDIQPKGEEWVEITNYGTTTIDLTDWTLSDGKAGHVYYFSSGNFGANSPANTPYPNLTINGTEIEVYFAPEDHAGDEIIKEIEAANHTIYFETFVFTHYGIEQAIIMRNKTDVNVKGIFERDMKYHSNSTFQNMSNNGINVIWDRSPAIMHNKVFIIDNKTVITGSFNPSNAADTRNDENVLIIHNESIAHEYINEFNKMWNEWPPVEPTFQVVISELYPNPIAKRDKCEFVELYNPTDNVVNLTGLELRDNDGHSCILNGTIPRYGFFLVGMPTYNDNKDNPTWPDADFTPATGFPLMANDGDEVRVYDSCGKMIDTVGWTAKAEWYEGLYFTPNPAEGKSLERKSLIEGYAPCQDTDNNSIDFSINDRPTPMNSHSQ